MHIRHTLLLAAIASVTAFAQAPGARPEFEVASVKPSAEADTPMGNLNRGIHIDGAMVTFTGMPLKWYVHYAYTIKEPQVTGPDYIDSLRYDVVAKLPSGAKREDIPLMVQALLADRFKLTVHKASKESQVYGLIVTKGGMKMKESPLDADTEETAGKTDVNLAASNNGVAVSLGKGASIAFEGTRMVAKKITMSYLADSLARFMDHPVVDMTGLTGTYDGTIDYNMDDLRNLVMSSAPPGTPMPPRQADIGETTVSLEGSLANLGLKMEPRRAPVETIVVDHIEKTPTAN